MSTPLELLFREAPLWSRLGWPEGTDVPLLSAVLIATRYNRLTVVGVLVIKGMDVEIAAGGICG